MAKRQSRRSLSVKGVTYQRLKNAQANGVIPGSISKYIEQLIADAMDRAGVPKVDKVEARAPAPAKKAEPSDDELKVASGIFSF